MGTRIPELFIPDDSDRGLQCFNCWGPGKPFGDGSSPDSVYVSISGVNKGFGWTPAIGEPPVDTYLLTQLPGIACFYRYLDLDIQLDLIFGSTDTQVAAILSGNIPFFVGQGTSPCETMIENLTSFFFYSGNSVYNNSRGD